MDAEANLPTFFSSLLLLLCSVLLSIIATTRRKQQQRDHPYWMGLAGIFLFLSIDEMTEVHERLIEPLRHSLHTAGFLYFAWVIPYGFLLLLVAALYGRFLFSLAPGIRIRFIVAGSIYLAGAIGVELIGGYMDEHYGEYNAGYALLTTLEESLEIGGLIAFIHALIFYISTEIKGINLRIGPCI